jgi:hypothetical protein
MDFWNAQTAGAAAFGAIIGWYVYYVNRYRKGDVQIGDLVTLIGVIGGAAVLALFPTETNLFGTYGIGLFFGFFGYFIALIIMVALSDDFGVEWFLDGRRKRPVDPMYVPDEIQPTIRAMGKDEPSSGRESPIN